MPNNPQEFNIETLSQSIKEWLGSKSLTYMIINLNQRLGLRGVKMGIIPDIILDLVEKKLKPQDALERVGDDLDVGPSKASAIVKEIEETMLRPIDLSLRRDLGIDVSLIYKTSISRHPERSEGSRDSSAMPQNDKKVPISRKVPLIETAEAAHPVKSYPPKTPTERESAGGTFNGTGPSVTSPFKTPQVKPTPPPAPIPPPPTPLVRPTPPPPPPAPPPMPPQPPAPPKAEIATPPAPLPQPKPPVKPIPPPPPPAPPIKPTPLPSPAPSKPPATPPIPIQKPSKLSLPVEAPTKKESDSGALYEPPPIGTEIKRPEIPNSPDQKEKIKLEVNKRPKWGNGN